MVKKSKKSKSKRVPLRKKYKILKRVKQHHKKKAKEAKKLGNKRRPKVEKDPGIPNDWPFKEQELKALEARRARALEELEQKKALRKERAQKRKLGLLDQDNEQNFAKEKGAEESGSKISKTRDNSERAFYKELIKVIDTSDVILEVLDARDPLGTRCVEMEKLVLKSGPDKHLVLLLNKIDLVPREAAEKWLKYLREELPAVAFKCSTQEQRSNLGWKSASKAAKTSNALQTSDCLGAETLLKLLKNYSRSHELKKSITVGVVGLPNVGKSSLINSLKRSHVVNVGSTPGLTRSMQEVQLDKHVKLLDCPGVVMLRPGESGISIALRNCKRIEKLDDPIGPVKEILKLCPAQKLMSLYKLPSFSSVDEFLLKVATLRGKLKKGGTVDVEAAARIVLRDWNEGKIPYYTFPPVRNQGENLESAIVSELGKEFNVDEIYNEESSFIGSLKPIIDSSHVEVPSSSPLNMDAQILEPEDENQVDGESMENQGEEESMACDETEATQTKPKTSRGQNDKLYKEEGILNPRKVRAEKKRRKALKLARSSEMDADYDFKVDYTKGRRSMTDMAGEDSSNDDDDYDGDDDGHGDDDDHDHRENDASGSAPMAGVELEA